MITTESGKVLWTNKQQTQWYFKFRCWLSYKKWWQYVLVFSGYHIILGYYYGYTTIEIYNFCKKTI